MSVSASKAKREAAKMAKAAASGKEIKLKKGAKAPLDAAAQAEAKLLKLKLQEDDSGLSDRVTTGVLASLPASRDVKITSASLVFHGKILFNDSTIEINFGRRYGLLGENGCGKSTFLKALAAREFPIPEHVDLYLLNEPAEPTEWSALEYVVRQAEAELARLEKLAEELLERDGAESVELDHLYEVCSFSLRLASPVLTLPPAYRPDGSLHLLDPRVVDSHWFGFQQHHHQSVGFASLKRGWSVRRMALAQHTSYLTSRKEDTKVWFSTMYHILYPDFCVFEM